jgi:hypothetical protein
MENKEADTIQEETTTGKNDRTPESKNNAPQTSRRQKKTPVTRTEYFL